MSGRNAADSATSSAVPGPKRFLAVDALRGMAIALMALDHCGFFTRTNVITETYSDRPVRIALGLRLCIGMITNLAAPTFWFLSGLSIALMAAGEQRRPEARGRTLRFVLVRALLLLVADVTLTSPLWNSWHPYVYSYDFGLLSSLAMNMLLAYALLQLPERVLPVLAAALALLHPPVAAWAKDALAHAPVLVRAWIRFGTDIKPPVIFPILGWFPLTALGVWIGRRIGRGLMPRPVDALGAAALLFATWLFSRVSNYGAFSPYRIHDGWRGWLIMSKGPVGLDYMSFNLGLSMLLATFTLAIEPAFKRSLLRVFVTLGRASLFLYFAHLLVYRGVAWGLDRVPLGGLPITARYLLAFVIGLVPLVPMARWYRQQKERRRGSLLQYL
jgi:uncharacterized membrane protein